MCPTDCKMDHKKKPPVSFQSRFSMFDNILHMMTRASSNSGGKHEAHQDRPLVIESPAHVSSSVLQVHTKNIIQR